MFFKRERTPIEIVLYGIYTYSRSNSFRLASEILKPLINRSHETIRNWYYRFNNISKIINPNIKSKIALIDETFFQIREKEAILWIAFEPNKRIFIDFQITIGRGS
jgi:transposase-like protein